MTDPIKALDRLFIRLNHYRKVGGFCDAIDSTEDERTIRAARHNDDGAQGDEGVAHIASERGANRVSYDNTPTTPLIATIKNLQPHGCLKYNIGFTDAKNAILAEIKRQNVRPCPRTDMTLVKVEDLNAWSFWFKTAAAHIEKIPCLGCSDNLRRCEKETQEAMIVAIQEGK